MSDCYKYKRIMIRPIPSRLEFNSNDATNGIDSDASCYSHQHPRPASSIIVIKCRRAAQSPHSIGNVPECRDCSPGRRHCGRYPVHRRSITENGCGSHIERLVVTYNITASVVTPHRPLELWVAATRRTDPERRQTSRVGLGGDGCCSGGVVFNGLRLFVFVIVFIQDALGLAGFPVIVAVVIVAHAALHQMEGPIGANKLFLRVTRVSKHKLVSRGSYSKKHECHGAETYGVVAARVTVLVSF